MRAALAEQTWVDYKPASFGSRSLAYVLDILIRWGAIGLVLLVLILLPGFADFIGGVGSLFEWIEKTIPGVPGAGKFLLAAAIAILFAIEWGYPIYFETRWEGVTPGKRIMGLRVVNVDGLPITWRASCLRNIVTIVDLMPGGGLFALVSMMSTAHHQRLGDLVAGTMVIHDDEQVDLTQLAKDPETEDPTGTVLLPLETYNILGGYIKRKPHLSPEFRVQGAQKLREALRPFAENVPPLQNAELWVDEVYRRARPIRKKFDQREADRTTDWKPVREELRKIKDRFDAMTSSAQPPTRGELYETAFDYQKICQRYAYLSTFFPDTEEANLSAGLVRYGRRIIYGRRLERSRADEREPFVNRIRTGFTASRHHVTFAASVAILSGVITAVLIQLNPQLSWLFLSEEIATQLESGQIWTDQIRGMESVAASKIFTNNIGVSLTVFALGVLGGFGALIVLLFNGAHIGGILSALTHYDMAHRLLGFMVAHGFLELSIIGVAGGCGIYLGDALINPGLSSRSEALRRRAHQVVDLLIFSALCLVPCGMVEGHLSPAEGIPVFFKVIVGIAICYVYWSMVLTGRAAAWNPLHSIERFIRWVARTTADS